MPINPERLADGICRLALLCSLRDLLANFNRELWTADVDAVGLRASIPDFVRSLIFSASNFANDESNASKMFRTSSLSVAKCGSV